MTQKQRKGTRLQARQDEHGVQAQFEHVEEYSIYPPAEFLQQLHQIDSKLVHQVMDMAQKEMEHRQALQNQQLTEIQRVNSAHIQYDQNSLALFRRGQWFGLIVAIGLMLVAIIAMYLNFPFVAGTAITAIIGILIVYVLRQSPNPPSAS